MYHSPDPLHPFMGKIMIEEVLVVAIVDGEKVKFPGTKKVPVSEQLPPLVIRETSVT